MSLATPIADESFLATLHGDQFLYSINRHTFESTDANTLYASHFGDGLREEMTFFVVFGSDSGLLIEYVISQAIPRGSKFLFIELPEVILRLQEKYGGLDPSDNLAVSSGEEWRHTAQQMGIGSYIHTGRIRLIRSFAVIDAYYEPYLQLWQHWSLDASHWVWEGQIQQTMTRHREENLRNLVDNITPVNLLWQKFRGRTAVVLGGGPSLAHGIEWLRQHRDRLIIIAASRIASALLRFDITPDIIVSIDPFDSNYMVSKEIYSFADRSLLIHGFHVNHKLLAGWGGRRLFLGPRYAWDNDENQACSDQWGPTVSNAAIGIAVRLGSAQVILLGVDLCYSPDGFTHSAGTAEHAAGPAFASRDQVVETNSGELAETKNEFLQAAAAIEEAIPAINRSGCRLINPAPHAARLKGVEHTPLESLILNQTSESRPFLDLLDELLPQDDHLYRLNHYRHITEVIQALRREIITIRDLAAEAVEINEKIIAKRARNRSKSLHAIEGLEKKIKQKSTGNQILQAWGLRHFVQTIRVNQQDEWTSEEYDQYPSRYYGAYLTTITELLPHIDRLLADCKMRINEESETSDLEALIAHWQTTQEYRRALLWQQRQPQQAAQIEPSLRQQIEELLLKQQEMDNAEEERNRQRVRKRSALQGINGRANRLFHQRNLAGLQQLRQSLLLHPDSATAGDNIHYIEGLCHELQGETEAALNDYAAISDRRISEDALLRRLGIAINHGDMVATLEHLTRLKDISIHFIPLYADTLRILGQAEAALEAYASYLDYVPNDTRILLKLGLYYHELKAEEPTRWVMNKVLEHDPNNATAINMLEMLNATRH
jgi:hypothetical protein